MVQVLVDEWFYKFGDPGCIHSDQGRNLESTLLRQLCELYQDLRVLSNKHNKNLRFEKRCRLEFYLPARLPHTSRVGGSISASAVCVEFACSPRALGVSSGYSCFLPQSKDMHCRLIGIFKLSVGCDCVS
ncbi:hypothetical protein QTP86_026361, partial [Hemibagrus guttatus]